MADELDFGTVALDQQRREEEQARRRAAEEALSASLLERLVGNAVPRERIETPVVAEKQQETPRVNGFEQTELTPRDPSVPTQRIPLSQRMDAQPSRSPMAPAVPFQKVQPGTTNTIGKDELEQYIFTSPETQKQFHLEKYKQSSPEDAAAYLADKVEKAPHEEVEKLDKWKEQDSLAKRMQGRQLALDERQADKKHQVALRSYAPSMNSAMSEFRSDMAALPDDPVARRAQMELDMKRDEMRRNQAPLNPLLWAAMSGTGRGQLVRDAGSQRMAMGNKNEEAALKAEFEQRKQEMNKTYLPDNALPTVGDSNDPRGLTEGTRISRNANGGIRLQGPGNDPEYLAKISQQARLSKPVESLEEFRQQQAMNRKQNTQLAEEKSKRNLMAMMLGRSGGALPKDADLVSAHAFNTGRRQGPTYADMLQYQKDETGKKRAEAMRGSIMDQVAKLNQVLANEKITGEPKKAAELQLAALMSQLNDVGGGGEADSTPTRRKSADELAAQGRPVVAANESKPLKSKTAGGRLAERLAGSVKDTVKEKWNEEFVPYDSLARYWASPINPLGGGPLQIYTQFNELSKFLNPTQQPESVKQSSRKSKDEDSVDSSPLYSGYGGY